jgi:hypothetical protein
MVAVCVWRLLRNRLPIKDNLVRHRVITIEDQLCTSGCHEPESTSHLVLHCDFFGSLWLLFRAWLGFSLVDPVDIQDHYVQFEFLASGSKVRRSFMHLIWFTCVWIV